jgi:GMP synthase (glutamine-hydrolysing)
MPKAPRFLIPDGYSLESRQQFKTVGMECAGQLYANLLTRRLPGAEYNIWYSSDPDAKAVSDSELSDYAGVIWPGCNITIYHHDDVRVQTHIDLCKRAYAAGIPQFGSCWAIQLANWTAGGMVEPHPKGREMGIGTKIRLTDAGKKHPMFEGKPEVYSHFVSHDDHVTRLADGATLLASNDWSRVHACEVRYLNGIFWGLQYHPEYNLHELARLIVAREDRLIKQGMFKDHDDAQNYVDRLEAVYADPSLKYIRWQLKLDDDVIDPDIYECEFANWIKHLVLPRLRQ